MIFRPCIDIHNGKVKQIVGSTLRDDNDRATENFVSDRDASWYAQLYKSYRLGGGHVINLNSKESSFYEQSKAQVISALNEFPGGLMAGGGINADNAREYIDAGASHVIVTSFVFSGGRVCMDNLRALTESVGARRIVLDLSCKKAGGTYLVATDRWQSLTDVRVNTDTFEELGKYCDGFLVHAVDAEGRSAGIDTELIGILATCDKDICYAGGISSYDDIDRLKEAGGGRVDFTVGSRLDIFGGDLGIQEIIECTR
ncbi:MAG: phosphoribosylformimino-5-aminoimidazole carboxamide ribotide isomerase [Lachnospiraceae bacterium]|nr:phosphoribosylformimino-5-aminoimidazole carboxamide ribotide isomerase [Lachnospiraceae bacterium]